MTLINRDTIVAFLLILLSVALYAATYDIRGLMMDPTMGPELWPRVVVGLMGLLSVIYLVLSMRGRYTEQAAERPPLHHFINPVGCALSFGLFMVLLPYLGFFVGGFIFIFVLLTFLGGWNPRSLVLHLAISAGAIAITWAMFTHVLRMYLPQGTLLRLF